MKSNYKKLGHYIREVCIKNKNVEITHLLGVSISKRFMPSIANIIGTDLSTYKIVKKTQFAYGPVTSRNGDKISIALLEDEECIVSQAYTVFEIIDKNLLDPEYLMMWFRRPEFDRYARFMSHGSVREIFGWEELCDVELPVPSIEEQRAIVAEYNTVLKNIKNNEKIIETLESTANAIYKEWFVDFNFPDENGNPYKSSGGAMVYNPTLEKEIPEGWSDGTVANLGDIICGKTPLTSKKENFGNYIPFITIPDMRTIFVLKTERSLSKIGVATQKNKTVPKYSICVSCIASPGKVCIASKESQTNQQINTIVCNKDNYSYIYFLAKELSPKIKEFGIGASVASNMNKNDFSNLIIIKPTDKIIKQYGLIVSSLLEKIEIVVKKNIVENEFLSLILSKMSSLGGA